MTLTPRHVFANIAKSEPVVDVCPALKWWVAMVLVGTVTFPLGACGGEFKRSEVNLQFVNNTDSLLCYFPNSEEAAAERFCEEVSPQKKRSWAPECGPGEDANLTATAVVLTVGLGGEVIYNRTATCKQWNDSGAKITIDRRDGKFVVTDSLPDE